MKKIAALALGLVLTTGLMTACRRPVTEEMNTTGTHGTTAATTPSTHATTPSTHATTPSTHTTESTAPHTTDGTNGLDIIDPTEHEARGRHRILPRY